MWVEFECWVPVVIAVIALKAATAYKATSPFKFCFKYITLYYIEVSFFQVLSFSLVWWQYHLFNEKNTLKKTWKCSWYENIGIISITWEYNLFLCSGSTDSPCLKKYCSAPDRGVIWLVTVSLFEAIIALLLWRLLFLLLYLTSINIFSHIIFEQFNLRKVILDF